MDAWKGQLFMMSEHRLEALAIVNREWQAAVEAILCRDIKISATELAGFQLHAKSWTDNRRR